MTECANHVIIVSDMGITKPRESGSELVKALKLSTRALLFATLAVTCAGCLPVNSVQGSTKARVEAVANPVVDSHMTRAEALKGVKCNPPQEVLDRQELVDVSYWGFR